MTLRLLSYLAPSLPAGLFEVLATHLGSAIGVDVELRFDASRSGPRRGEREPFSSGEVDVAFVCATSYVWLTSGERPCVELAGAAWVPTDPRAAGRAVYFGDVLAPTGTARSLADLEGRRVAYNDDVSLSGYHSLLLALVAAGLDPSQVELVRSGSHLRSLELLDSGEVDAATVDSNVWRRCRRQDRTRRRRLVTVAELGPHPVQPVVVRHGLDAELRARLRRALLRADAEPLVASALHDAELIRFVSVGPAHYAALRTQMRELGIDGSVLPSS